MKKQPITAKIGAVIALVLFVGLTTSLSQPTESAYKLMPLPEADQKIYNLGIVHKPNLKSPNEIAYSDTALVNYFFRKISGKVNPNKVVLVTEDIIQKGLEDKILMGQSVWITPEMQKMGFVKWVAADPRPFDSNYAIRYNTAFRKIIEFTNTYYKVSYEYNNHNFYGLPTATVSEKKIVSDSANKEIRQYLFAIAEDHKFESNIKRLCGLVRKQGYIPIVVAGAYHVLALDESCMIQLPSQMNIATQKLATYLFQLKACDYILRTFGEK